MYVLALSRKVRPKLTPEHDSTGHEAGQCVSADMGPCTRSRTTLRWWHLILWLEATPESDMLVTTRIKGKIQAEGWDCVVPRGSGSKVIGRQPADCQQLACEKGDKSGSVISHIVKIMPNLELSLRWRYPVGQSGGSINGSFNGCAWAWSLRKVAFPPDQNKWHDGDAKLGN